MHDRTAIAHIESLVWLLSNDDYFVQLEIIIHRRRKAEYSCTTILALINTAECTWCNDVHSYHILFGNKALYNSK